MAKFRRGPAAAAEPKPSRRQSTFVRNFFFKAGEKTLLQLLPATLDGRDDLTVTLDDDTVAVLAHEWVNVGTRDNGKTHYETFVSRRDKSLEGVDGVDLIWDFGDGKIYWPSEVTYAVAMELEGDYETVKGRKKLKGVTPKMRSYTDKEGVEHEVPVIGVIAQKWSNFWEPLSVLQDDKGFDLESTVFAVVRTSDDNGKTVYSWIDQTVEAVDPEEYKDAFIDLENYLTELADLDRMKGFIESLPEDHVLNEYQYKNYLKKQSEAKKDDKPASNKGRGKKAKDDDETTPPWKEDGEGSDDFEALKNEINSTP